MSEQTRIRKYYRPRIQVPVDVMFNEPGEWAWYCLPKDGVSLLRRILDYGKRQITYIDETINDKVFLMPDEPTMELIRDIVDSTGVALMSECGLDLIVDAIDRNTAALEALQCVCSALQGVSTGSIYGPDITDGIADGTYSPRADYPIDYYGPQADAPACAIAQLMWAFCYETMTEVVMPAARTTFDNLLPAVAGIVGGFLTTPLGGLAIYAVAELIQELLEIGYTVSEQNYINWLFSVKEEWVCAAYEVLRAGGSNEAVAQAVYSQVVSPSSTISAGDKLATKLFGGRYAVSVATAAYGQDSSWAQENVEPGYCNTCTSWYHGQCVLIPECAPEDWSGGSWQCEAGRAWLIGGNGYYTALPVVCPSDPLVVRMRWVPRSLTGYPIAKCQWGVYSDSQGLLIFEDTPDRPVNVPVTETYAPDPPLGVGEFVYLWVKQETHSCEPIGFCVDAS